jgi:hypothetical protein
MVPLRAPKVKVKNVCFSVKMLHQAWWSLGKVVVHLGAQRPTDPLQTTVMDYAFKINVLARELERGVLPPSTTMTAMTMAASTSPAPAPAPAAAPLQLRRWGSFGGDYLCLINL